MTVTIRVLMTTHNRRAQTLACLGSLQRQLGLGTAFEVRVVLVDAGSGDGTAEAVRHEWPHAIVHQTGNDVFWGSGMRMADRLSSHIHRDFDLWLNDDVLLAPDAIERLLESSKGGSNSIIVGQLLDERGGASYGGFRRAGRPLALEVLGVRDREAACDTFNGNVVLIPRAVRDSVGEIDPALPHAMGDIDYGFRARRKGVDILQAPNAVGVCKKNEPLSAAGSPLRRLRRVCSVKHLPPTAWWTLCRRHTGLWAPLYFAKPYLAALMGER